MLLLPNFQGALSMYASMLLACYASKDADLNYIFLLLFFNDVKAWDVTQKSSYSLHSYTCFC